MTKALNYIFKLKKFILDNYCELDHDCDICNDNHDCPVRECEDYLEDQGFNE